MKKFKELKNKEDFYIGFIYLLVAFAILANFSQLIVLKYKFGNFHFGELILIMFNDSYTGYFTFPFLLAFIMMLQSPVEQNIFFVLSRYSSRNDFYRNKHFKILKSVIYYVVSMYIFSTIVGNFETNIVIYEIGKIIILQGLLLYFFSLLHALLTQFRISQSLVFVIYTGILIIMAGSTLGFLGEHLRQFSLFSISGSVYGYGINFIGRCGILVFVDAMLLLLNFKIFENKDIALPKGSKQYQNE